MPQCCTFPDYYSCFFLSATVTCTLILKSAGVGCFVSLKRIRKLGSFPLCKTFSCRHHICLDIFNSTNVCRINSPSLIVHFECILTYSKFANMTKASHFELQHRSVHLSNRALYRNDPLAHLNYKDGFIPSCGHIQDDKIKVEKERWGRGRRISHFVWYYNTEKAVCMNACTAYSWMCEFTKKKKLTWQWLPNLFVFWVWSIEKCVVVMTNHEQSLYFYSKTFLGLFDSKETWSQPQIWSIRHTLLETLLIY